MHKKYIAIHAAKIHSLIHVHNYYAHGTLCIYASANTAVIILHSCHYLNDNSQNTL